MNAINPPLPESIKPMFQLALDGEDDNWWWTHYGQHSSDFIQRELGTRRPKRSKSDVPAIYSSLTRYFIIMGHAKNSLSGKFTTDEVITLLNLEPSEWWRGGFEVNVASALYEEYALEEHEEMNTPMHRLGEKLMQLEVAEKVALIDVLECAWKSKTQDPLSYAGEKLGIKD